MAGRRVDGALTLVEILIAMAILTVISASTVLVFRGISNAWRTGELRTERYQQARLLFDLFDRELSSVVLNSRFPLVGLPASDGGAVRGEGAHGELFFAGLLPGRGRLVERGYWVTADGAMMCHDDESGDGDYATGTQELCGQGIEGFTLAFFNGSEWREQWDGRPGASEAGQLPKAVRVTLAVGRPRPETFETIIHVPTS